MKKAKDLTKTTSCSKVYKRARKELTCNCSFCKYHKGENVKRQAKHGCKKPRYKDKR